MGKKGRTVNHCGVVKEAGDTIAKTAAEAERSTPTTTMEELLCNGPLQNSISTSRENLPLDKECAQS